MAFGKRRIPKHLVIDEYYHYVPKSKQPKLSFCWLAGLTLVTGFFLFFAIGSRAEETTNAGILEIRSAKGKQPALLVETVVEAEINGLIAHTSYKQLFKNQSSDWQEGIYSFPLPETAGVHYMEMKVGDRTIIGEIKEKHEAKRIYKQALKQGKRAALTEQQRPNMFTQKIANIPPGEEIEILIQYQQKIEYRNKGFEWRLPTTYTPRYIPGKQLGRPTKQANQQQADESLTLVDDFQQSVGEASMINELISDVETDQFGWAMPTDQVPDAQLITPPMKKKSKSPVNTISIDIRLNSGLALSNISSLYHDVSIVKQDKAHHISLTHGQTDMDRDYVLQWSPVESKAPSAALFNEEVDGDFYSLLMLIPPTEPKTAKLARDIIFIIDTSSSMQGPSIHQARQSLSLALQELSNSDRFNVIEFNSQFSLLFDELKPATQKNVQQSLYWVNRLNANGGTEMHSALDAAFEQMPESERLQQIVFITDGAVGNESALFKLIHDKLDASRLFTVGIGSAPNSYFMRKAAEFGRGSFSHIGQDKDISEVMLSLFTKLNSALSTNIKIEWPRDVEQYPQRIGDLYKDEAMLVAARSKEKLPSVNISGELHRRQWHRSVSNRSKHQQKGVAGLWAREKIEHIEDQKIAGSISESTAKQSILDVALKHKLVSRFTSFIAVEKQAARPAETTFKTKSIPNQIARGQSVSPVMLPQTATTAEVAWWLGLFGFTVFLIGHRMRGDDR